MKKFIFSLFFFAMMVAGADAQKASCAKTCTKSAANSAACQSKAPSVAAANTTDNSIAAAKMASLDPSIETKTDPVTGNVSYVRKETCSHSGTVSYVDVSYDATTSTFVNVSPMKTEETGKASGCGSKSAAAGGKACCAGKGSAAKSAEKVKS